MSRGASSVVVAGAALLALAVSGCAKHEGILAPTFKDPAVFDDGLGAYVDFQAFAGSKLDALAIDSTVAYSGATSIRITVPAPGDPTGTYAGGAFTTNRARDLSGYDALTFWARASRAVTFNVVGIGNDNTGTSKFDASWANVAMTTEWKKFVIPIPLPSRLRDEKGLFYFAEGPEMGQGATVWFDDILFENLGTVTNPRPSIPTQSISPDVGTWLTVTGAKVTFAVDGLDRTLDLMQGYLTFASSADSVVTGGEGVARVVGLGTATVTASLGGVPATGAITVTAAPAPTAGPPAPTVPAANVISLFSNSYTNVAVDTWSAPWDLATLSDVQIAGNDAKKYTGLTYAGIEFTGSHVIDASTMTHFHLDVWAAAGTNVKVKLVDFGANGSYGGGDDREHELTFTSASTPAFSPLGWSSLEIPLSSFTNLTTRAHLAQLILAGDVGTLYVDNVYFHN